MIVLITIAAIIIITAIMHILNALELIPLKICPICAGVSTTWLVLLILMFGGYEIEPIVPGILMGASISGIAYSLDKFTEHRSTLFGKTIILSAGFAAVYSILEQRITTAGYLLVALAVFIYFYYFARKTAIKEEKAKVRELEEKMKNCCQ